MNEERIDSSSNSSGASLDGVDAFHASVVSRDTNCSSATATAGNVRRRSSTSVCSLILENGNNMGVAVSKKRDSLARAISSKGNDAILGDCDNACFDNLATHYASNITTVTADTATHRSTKSTNADNLEGFVDSDLSDCEDSWGAMELSNETYHPSMASSSQFPIIGSISFFNSSESNISEEITESDDTNTTKDRFFGDWTLAGKSPSTKSVAGSGHEPEHISGETLIVGIPALFSERDQLKPSPVSLAGRKGDSQHLDETSSALGIAMTHSDGNESLRPVNDLTSLDGVHLDKGTLSNSKAVLTSRRRRRRSSARSSLGEGLISSFSSFSSLGSSFSSVGSSPNSESNLFHKNNQVGEDPSIEIQTRAGSFCEPGSDRMLNARGIRSQLSTFSIMPRKSRKRRSLSDDSNSGDHHLTVDYSDIINDEAGAIRNLKQRCEHHENAISLDGKRVVDIAMNGSSMLDDCDEEAGQKGRHRGSIALRRTSVSVFKNRPSLGPRSTLNSASSSSSTRLNLSQSFSNSQITNVSKNQVNRSRWATGEINSIDDAISILDSAQNNWESVVAAAAVVAAGQSTMKAKKHRRYAVGEKTLVALSVLNSSLRMRSTAAIMRRLSSSNLASRTDQYGGVDEEDSSKPTPYPKTTLCPVNKHGFPRGYAGLTAEEQQGPYAYVLAIVKRVHYAEDEQYYTVTRADNGLDQRADVEWMQPLSSERGEEAAAEAAQITSETQTNTESPLAHGKTCLWSVVLTVMSGFDSMRSHWLHKVKPEMQRHATMFLYGQRPYVCKMNISLINLLVACNIVFVFIDTARLAFFSRRSDLAVVFISFIVWVVLAVELALEVLIRPSGYSMLMNSERAFDPSTARYINSFHLTCEIIALACFIPELQCITNYKCDVRYSMSLLDASMASLFSPIVLRELLGRFFFVFSRLRAVGLVRHWKQMWFKFAAYPTNLKQSGWVGGFIIPRKGYGTNGASSPSFVGTQSKKKPGSEIFVSAKGSFESTRSSMDDEERLKEAATINTALMVINSHRCMIIVFFILGGLPLLISAAARGASNMEQRNALNLLQASNVNVPAFYPDETQCSYLDEAVSAWLKSNSLDSLDLNLRAKTSESIIWAQLLPVRCDFQALSGVITRCPEFMKNNLLFNGICKMWDMGTNSTTPEEFGDTFGIRAGAIETLSNAILVDGQIFNVTVMVDHTDSIAFLNSASFNLQIGLLVLVLLGLSVLRSDASILVMNPLRRMLKIVLLYAANPLSTAASEKGEAANSNDAALARTMKGALDSDDQGQLGNYETEQLINAIGKITDLLRKCWGVAGAGIISSNLARTKYGKTVVFNPTVPGKLVYALFGFAGINEFSKQLRALDQDVMILINDVAKIVHDEVFRWGLGTSGQCNKNLGSTFLMVFRIGDFEEVKKKRELATNVIFSSPEGHLNKKSLALKHRRVHSNKARNTLIKREGDDAFLYKGTGDLSMDAVQLRSLPGISSFTDRALIGFLKSFAGIYRDKKLREWGKDFRLGLGVGAFSVDMIFGMDAGWAVEGAVGSEYKIDATYLSPHVNMAARMMSACKQYGVSILVSQAVEELLSVTAREKMRHLDTVTVKGSSVQQRIYTYDARHQGVDFFLYERSPELADLDSDRYTANIWNTDQDLLSMRKHITMDFEEAFNDGRNQYIAGDWKNAIASLKLADSIMTTAVVEDGCIDFNVSEGLLQGLLDDIEPDEELASVRNDYGDGPCRCLISYMEKSGGCAPRTWNGYRPLTSK